MESMKNLGIAVLLLLCFIAIFLFGMMFQSAKSTNSALSDIFATPTAGIPSEIPTDIPTDTPVPPPPAQSYPQHCMELPSYGGIVQPIICN